MNLMQDAMKSAGLINDDDVVRVEYQADVEAVAIFKLESLFRVASRGPSPKFPAWALRLKNHKWPWYIKADKMELYDEKAFEHIEKNLMREGLPLRNLWDRRCDAPWDKVARKWRENKESGAN